MDRFFTIEKKIPKVIFSFRRIGIVLSFAWVVDQVRWKVELEKTLVSLESILLKDVMQLISWQYLWVGAQERFWWPFSFNKEFLFFLATRKQICLQSNA